MDDYRASVMCPNCRSAVALSAFQSSPYRPGKRCWRCSGRYIEVVPAEQLRGAVSRAEVLRGALLAIGSGHPDPVALAQRTLREEARPSTTGGR